MLRATMRTPRDRRQAAWFFRTHDREELARWTASLRFFRFVRAIGGHANDGDSLEVALRFDSERDLVALATGLGIVLREAPAAPVARRRRARRAEELGESPCRIDGHPRFLQPCLVELDGVRCFAWVYPGSLVLRLSGAGGDPYEVIEDDVREARRLEVRIAPFADRVLEPSSPERCFPP